jgi:hypothetical protein
MAATCRLGVGLGGETDAYINRYHDQASDGKLAAGAQTDQTLEPRSARLAPPALQLGAGNSTAGPYRG